MRKKKEKENELMDPDINWLIYISEAEGQSLN